MPWAIHLSGKTEATCCIQVGSWSNAKKTPEMNCRIRTTGFTTALAARPERGTDENPMPHTHPVAVESTKTQANVTQADALVGIGTSNSVAATASRRAVCARQVTSTSPILPRK